LPQAQCGVQQLPHIFIAKGGPCTRDQHQVREERSEGGVGHVLPAAANQVRLSYRPAAASNKLARFLDPLMLL
jgi:hypothetical protein